MRMRTFAVSVLVTLSPALCPVPDYAAQQSPSGSTVTPEQVQTYEAFRSWITKQPVEVQRAEDAVMFQRYAAELRNQGKSEEEVASTIESLRTTGDRAEIERWNRILTSPTPRFNTAPNTFLVE
jgi:hypothetical protein